MSANNARVQSIIENTIFSAVKELTSKETGTILNDLYIQADAESGELQIFDEAEVLLEKVVIFDWVNSHEEGFSKKTGSMLKAVLVALTAKNLFNHPHFLKPFSVSLVDEDFRVIEELLFIDDDTFRLDDPLLKDLDIDLDNFLEDLLSDLPK
jgi:hypothetical protein